VVDTADRGREFAFTRTEPGGGTIRWFFRLEPDAEGTAATLGYQVLKPVPVGLHVILRAFLGVRDLEANLRLNITTSLGRIAEIAEREALVSAREEGGKPPPFLLAGRALGAGGSVGSTTGRREPPILPPAGY
jgi:hypothetical protein